VLNRYNCHWAWFVQPGHSWVPSANVYAGILSIWLNRLRRYWSHRLAPSARSVCLPTPSNRRDRCIVTANWSKNVAKSLLSDSLMHVDRGQNELRFVEPKFPLEGNVNDFTIRYFTPKLLISSYPKHRNMIIRCFSLRGAIVRVRPYVHFEYIVSQHCTINIVTHRDVSGAAYVISDVITYDWIIGSDQWGYIHLRELLDAHSEG
jgi:hypothetical protein